ncbi:helix-turn-helix domain-containing protein [Lactococcus allomyrinae]|uniref:XRE family transcriptional regulator n=1 Tax=Lactococcus allomyrinae TaxID=2419773 RepID=A0A387BIH0_9LACT|nr:helix-turn-helix transcriptional regulator [Lactococcus allomyrinae]AYG01159.1 XRE family transcriptional regulator [Lactococcus allomyrinae]
MKEKLKQLLNERDLSYYRLSKLTGIASSTFAALNTGKINYLSFENMVRIAQVLDVSLDIFIPDKK